MMFSSSASQPSSTDLGWGYVPNFPGAIVFSDSTLINSIISNIPYLITGLLGFAVLTLFLVVRQSNRFVWIAALAVTCEFLAAIFDLDQLLQRGNFAVQTGTNVSPPIIIVREVMLSLAPGFFFLFFWFFVALPPRGELQPPYGKQPFSRTLGILNYSNAYHCGRWNRWGLLGMVLQWIVLAVVFSVPALQIAWRMLEFTVPFGTVYNASVTTEILLSCLFILKINGNVWLSNLGEKWRTFRDYLPIMFCLSVGLGVRVGNVEVFKFSDAPLGRFLQAVETYVLFLYILCATFYPSMSSKRASDAAPFADPENGSVRKLNMQFKPVTGDAQAISPIVPPRVYGLDNKSGFRLPADEENQDHQVASPFSKTPGVQLNDLSLGSPNTGTSMTVESSLAVLIPEDNISPSRFYPPSMTESSPIYGLNGVVRESAVPSSINSRVSDLSSLYRRQAELDKSVEGLLRFSKRTTLTSVKSPAGSDFSLSNFPDPPIAKSPTNSSFTGPLNEKRELVMGNTTFSLVPPSMPAHGRQASVPVSMQGSEDGLFLGGERGRFPSNATRYDVTSFIGGYAVSGNSPSSLLRQQSREGSTKTLQSIDERNSTTSASDFLPPRTMLIRRGQDPPFISPLNPNRSNINNSKMPQALKLEISRPLQRYSVEDALAYERPRDAPTHGEGASAN